MESSSSTLAKKLAHNGGLHAKRGSGLHHLLLLCLLVMLAINGVEQRRVEREREARFCMRECEREMEKGHPKPYGFLGFL